MENLRIGIIGNIGVGKSTLVTKAKTEPFKQQLLALFPGEHDDVDIHTFDETFNPAVLDEFYKDPVKNAFMAQIEFFNGRLERQKSIENSRGIILEDRTLAEDYHIFGKAQRILGNMTEAEFQAYQRTYHLMTETFKEPDILVFLRADVDVLLQRIANRGRESEKLIQRDYLQQLNYLYEEFIANYVKCPVLIIDTNSLPEEEFVKTAIDLIANRISELHLRITTPGIRNWVKLPETQATLKAIDIEKKLEAYLKANPTLITIAGNVGLGKSTITAIMERSLNLTGIYEKPEENPLLEKFLGDKKSYCYELQLHFLKMRAEQRLLGKTGDKSYVKDRSLAEDLLVFCPQFHQSGLLTDVEMERLTTEFHKTNTQLPSADLIIHLVGNPKLAWQRITQRGREMEMQGGWSEAEITNLNQWYQGYGVNVVKYGFHSGKVIEIDVTMIDLLNRVHIGYVFERIYEVLRDN
ncbi:MAG: deoxynucleoside kinase [Candidatus Cloacimonadales bacterium]